MNTPRQIDFVFMHAAISAFLLLGMASLPACNGTRAIVQKAVMGDKASQFEYGRRLLIGKRAPVSPKQAVLWLNAAARQHHAGAEAALGVCYELGLGTEADTGLAKMWYEKAMNHGHPHALLSLARLELKEKRMKKAVAVLSKGSDMDLIPAQLMLARLYMGGSGIKESPDLAVENIRYAAMNGSGEAAYLMFLCFAEGYGVPTNHQLAGGWLANAAELGYEPAKKIQASLASGKAVNCGGN